MSRVLFHSMKRKKKIDHGIEKFLSKIDKTLIKRLILGLHFTYKQIKMLLRLYISSFFILPYR